ncbi:MAG TPA: ThiF family adenylyltransferase [Candidatus Polarisedimenticolaceae bacterium]|nr:ThiF family adenylyltransferase [Candidatus Polarisedimenticolaceae bacterium]
MSQQLINRSPDLKKLRDEGYDVEVRSGYLLIKDVPYVNSNKEVKLGILVSELKTAGEITVAPGNHQAMFVGELPCSKDGVPMEKLVSGGTQRLSPELEVNHSFSCKLHGGVDYADYYQKMTTYVNIFTSPAQAIDANATAQTFPVIPTDPDESVFEYVDTATSRAGIGLPASKLESKRLAILGLGGTGSYILDLVAKTHVKEIHLFDADRFLTHNAFRAPGAVSRAELETRESKVGHFKEIYSKLHRGIIPHEYDITADNVSELELMDCVFLCMDPGDPKVAVVDHLEDTNITFIDTGMGVELVEDSLRGMLRVTTSTPTKRDHFRSRVPIAAPTANAEYERNIQIADLNAMNACIAVIKWKKLCGFYLDFEREHDSTYVINTNVLDSDDHV